MVKNNKVAAILLVFALSAVLLTGCSAVAGGETGLEGKSEVVGSKEVKDKTTGQAVKDKTTYQVVEDKSTGQAETQSQAAAANGTLKAVNAAGGEITIAAKSGDELVLQVNNESKILIDGSLSPLTKLATKIGSEVRVEYHAKTKSLITVTIQN